MITVSMCTAIIAISAWLTIPFTVSFTLQTLAIFVISAVFKLRISISSVALYILLGACGLPIFSGFGAGLSALLGPTGGYILGFVFIPIIMSLIPHNKKIMLALSMTISLLACYTLGTVWYLLAYGSFAVADIVGALSICVLPFILPDAIKIALAVILATRLKRIIKYQ